MAIEEAEKKIETARQGYGSANHHIYDDWHKALNFFVVFPLGHLVAATPNFGQPLAGPNRVGASASNKHLSADHPRPRSMFCHNKVKASKKTRRKNQTL